MIKKALFVGAIDFGEKLPNPKDVLQCKWLGIGGALGALMSFGSNFTPKTQKTVKTQKTFTYFGSNLTVFWVLRVKFDPEDRDPTDSRGWLAGRYLT